MTNSTFLKVQRERAKFIDKLFNLKSLQVDDLLNFQRDLIEVSINHDGTFLRNLTHYLGDDNSTSYVVFIVNHGVCKTLDSVLHYGFPNIFPNDGDKNFISKWAKSKNALMKEGRVGDILLYKNYVGFVLGHDGQNKYHITSVQKDNITQEEVITSSLFHKPTFINLHGLYNQMLDSARKAFKDLVSTNSEQPNQ